MEELQEIRDSITMEKVAPGGAEPDSHDRTIQEYLIISWQGTWQRPPSYAGLPGNSHFQEIPLSLLCPRPHNQRWNDHNQKLQDHKPEAILATTIHLSVWNMSPYGDSVARVNAVAAPSLILQQIP